MRDGITTRSGNSRYLKSVENFLNLYPNYEAFANALIAGTLPVDLNGINPAGWQQLGTSLSKANLLSDETESAIFGNAADRAVDQALYQINAKADFSFRIGDIKTTVRTDLGDDWLLCNGDEVSASAYPALRAIAKEDVQRWTELPYTFNCDVVGHIVTDGQYYAVCAASEKKIYYTDNLYGTWTEKTLSISYRFNFIRYFEGYWVAGTNDGKIFYTTDITGDWNYVQAFSTSRKIWSIDYDGGYYIADHDDGCSFSTDFKSSSWTSVSGCGRYPSYVGYANGHWFFTYSQILYCFDIQNASVISSVSMGYDVEGIVYDGSRYIVALGSYFVAYSTSHSGPFTNKQLSTRAGDIYSIHQYDGYTIIIFSVTDNPYKYKVFKNITSDQSFDGVFGSVGKNMWTFNGLFSTGYSTKISIADSVLSRFTPTITYDGAYAYIKGR